MKKLELKELGVQEMNTTELTTVEGGGLLGDLLSNTLATVVGTTSILANNALSFVGYTVNKLVGVILS
ncbi:hypothetical protein SNE25_28455 [Mucilaginibacter sabulilitoris]|uniref:Bacteriocin n=1 Tax=Mucilaginibacter sabulilitoris TaxID=1173583 RepID=A0ABZ0TJF1_9SPHI|nr:hypothetical protein [Mucilaginibacter sabulilitoris]WPU93257.1 hypothetical protein SNE25_28455 [Mucilaginibacter sabulilitoris]